MRPRSPSLLHRPSAALKSALVVGTEGRYKLINNQYRAPPVDITLLQRFFERFNVSPSHYALQQADGSYIARHAAPSPVLYVQHLAGLCTVAPYALDRDTYTAKWVCIDLDQDDGFDRLKHVQADLLAKRVSSLLEASRRGGHLWLFLGTDYQTKTAAINLAHAIQTIYELKADIFPKHGGLGGCVRLPLGIHRKTGKRYNLWNHHAGNWLYPQDQPTQLRFIVNYIHPVNADALTQLVKDAESKDPEAKRHQIVSSNTTASLKVRQLREFLRPDHIGFEPDRNGMMSCPLHPPDRHPSFHWNEQERLWCCFHENSGGDLIDLFRRLRNNRTGIPREQAIDDLYRFMLKDRQLQRPPPTPHAS